MAVLTYEQLEKSVLNTAWGVVKHSSKLEFEDVVNDLWEWMLIKQPENLALARTQLKNRGLDILRKSIRQSGGICNVDYNDPMGILFVEENKTRVFNCNQGFENAVLSDIMKSLGGKERTYVIAKGYLCEDIFEFEEEYNEIFSSLSKEDQERILNYEGKYTDDIIIKVFLHVKTGTNSGSARTLKANLKKHFREFSGLVEA